jgi:dethiobiotin synthetase
MTSSLRGLFVTGTDTGVGKTTVGVGLLRYALRQGRHPIAVKPVETGCAPDPADAIALSRAAGEPLRLSDVCPHRFRLPAAPAQAAAAEGQRLDLPLIVDHIRSVATQGDFLLVEGAGGLLVPYADGATAADLAATLHLPLLIVARTALGTVNHSSLTIREAARAGLPVAALILNETAAEPGPHTAGNAALIADVTGVRAAGQLPYISPDRRDDADYIADQLLGALGPATLAQLLS